MLQGKCCISWACGFRPRSQNRGEHPWVIWWSLLDLELRPTTCTVLAVAAAPCLLSALVAYIYQTARKLLPHKVSNYLLSISSVIGISALQYCAPLISSDCCMKHWNNNLIIRHLSVISLGCCMEVKVLLKTSLLNHLRKAQIIKNVCSKINVLPSGKHWKTRKRRQKSKNVNTGKLTVKDQN